MRFMGECLLEGTECIHHAAAPKKLQPTPRRGLRQPPSRVWETVFSGQTPYGTMAAMPPSILIVDDHPSFRATARALLQAEGYTIVGEAVDGASALAAARELKPEVVLLDVQLPDTDGFAVAAELAREQHPPAVVLTSSRDASDFGPLVTESGARGFVPKAELSGETLTEALG